MSNTTNTDRKLLVFTGGHHTSGLVVAQAARLRGWHVVWIGHKHSMSKDQNLSAEYREVTAAGIPFYDLQTGKIFGSGNILALFTVLSGLVRSLNLLRKFPVDHRIPVSGIVSFGGYLSVPVVLAAWLLRLPCLTHEQTIVGGAANRFLANFVKMIALSWPDSRSYFPQSKTVVTGLPLRPEILAVHRKGTLHQPLTLFVQGGKQGSHILNLFIQNHLTDLLRNFILVHQTGTNSQYNDFHRCQILKSQLPPDLADRYRVQTYYSPSEISEILAGTDVFIGRSGAHTVYELGLLGIPAVLVPIPWSSRGEQMANAIFLSRMKRAVILPQSKLSYSTLIQSIDTVLTLKPEKLNLIPDGTENLLNLIDSTIFN